MVSAQYNTSDPYDLLQSIAEVIDSGGDRQHLQRSFSSQSDKLPSSLVNAAEQLPVDDKEKDNDKAAIDAVKHSLLSDAALSLSVSPKEPLNGSLANATATDDLCLYPTTVSKSEPAAVAVLCRWRAASWARVRRPAKRSRTRSSASTRRMRRLITSS